MLLRETQNAFAELAASQADEFGVHFASEARAGVPGMVISELEYDPARHQPQNIAPFSLMETVTGTPHVQLVLPQQPMELTVITHHEAGRDDPRLGWLKQRLATQVREAAEYSLPSSTDRIRSYYVGSAEAAPDDRDTEVITIENDPELAAKTIGELCVGGLTLVISDFNRLPLHTTQSNFRNTVAVKANHPAELALPAKAGIIRVGGQAEVNTNKPKELQRFNDRLTARHQQISEQLGRAGIAVAQVIFDPRQASGTGFDLLRADQSIAAAVRAANDQA